MKSYSIKYAYFLWHLHPVFMDCKKPKRLLCRQVLVDGLGEEEMLVVTGGAADHLAMVYRTDDQVAKGKYAKGLAIFLSHSTRCETAVC
jgi:hypothetical protein